MTKIYPKATFYARGDWGYKRTEAKNAECDIAAASVSVLFTPKGTRSPHQYSQSSGHFFVMLEGWGHPDPPSGWLPFEGGMSGSKYTLANKQYDVEFDAFLQEYLAGSSAVLLLDARLAPVVSPPSFRPIDKNNANTPLQATSQAAPGNLPLDPFLEGDVTSELVNTYERNPAARRQCLAHYGRACQGCKVDFLRVYGELGPKIIHVHHLKPLAEIGAEYEVDPIRDLIPVCPNCHAMLHQRTPPFTIAELHSMLGGEP